MHARVSVALLGAVAMAIVTLVATGCADSSWEGARRRDTVAAYQRFLRENPGSRLDVRAHERIAYLRVISQQSVDAVETFAAEFPKSKLLGELRVALEPSYFERARHENTSRSYRKFLDIYPNGELGKKAKGNLIYIEVVNKNPTAAVLQAFVDQYPESDYAAEATYTLELFQLRSQTQIQVLGVRVEVAPNVAQPNRVRRGFASMVARHYEEIGVNVSLIPPGDSMTPGMDAWMRIDYEEPPAAGVFGGRTLRSRCRIRLYHKDSEKPVWDRTFETLAEHEIKGAYGRDKTVFGNSSYAFWQDFFVPISTWTTSRTQTHRMDFLEEVSAIDVNGDRAALLYLGGGFDILDVSSPRQPKVLERYRREHDLAKWTGIKLISPTLAFAYGPDGAELIGMGGLKPRRMGRWELHEVGAVRAADVYDETLLFASSKGVYAIRLQNRPLTPHRLLDGEYVGIEVANPFIFLVRPTRVEVSSPKHLVRHLSGSRLHLGKLFGAYKARLQGTSLFVFGKKAMVEVSLANPTRPELKATLEPKKFGSLNDISAHAGNLYLLGTHGLQVAGPGGAWMSDAIQVEADQSIDRKGRFAFLVGKRSLEVLDLGPYYAGVPANSR